MAIESRIVVKDQGTAVVKEHAESVDQAMEQVETSAGGAAFAFDNFAKRSEDALRGTSRNSKNTSQAFDKFAVFLEVALKRAESGFKDLENVTNTFGNMVDEALSKAEQATEKFGLTTGTVSDRADTALKKVESRLGVVGAAANEFSRRADDALQRAENALHRFQGTGEEVSDRAEQALKKIEDRMGLLAPAANVASDKTNAALNKLEGKFEETADESRSMSQRVRDALERMADKIEAAVQRSIGLFGRLNTAFNTGVIAARRFTSRIEGVVNGLFSLRNALLGLGFALLVRTIFNAADALQGYRASIDAAAGSTEEGAKQFRFVQAQAERLGLVLDTVSDSYKGILAATLASNNEANVAQEIFLGIAEAGTVMRLSNDDMAGSLRAVQQILQKGRVFAEEWNQQLGDRFPVAAGLMAESLGIATSDLAEFIQAGNVGIPELLQFARNLRVEFADDLAKAIERTRAEINRATNDFALFSERVGKGGLLTGIKEVATAFRSLFAELENSGVADELGEVFAILGKKFAEIIKDQGPDLVKTFNRLVKVMKDNFTPAVETAGSVWSTVWLGANVVFNQFVADFAVPAGEIVSLINGIIKGLETSARFFGFTETADELKRVSEELTIIEDNTISIKVAAETLRDQYLFNLREMKKEMEDTSKTIGLTADEVRGLGQGALVAAGDVLDSGRQIRKVMEDDVAAPTAKGKKAVDELAKAYEDLGIETPKALKTAARSAATAFETILNKGDVTKERLAEIFEPVAKKIIEAFGTIPPEFESIFFTVESITGQSFRNIDEQGKVATDSIKGNLKSTLDDIQKVSTGLSSISGGGGGGGSGGGGGGGTGGPPRDPGSDVLSEVQQISQDSQNNIDAFAAFFSGKEFVLADSIEGLEQQLLDFQRIVRRPERIIGIGGSQESLEAFVALFMPIIADIEDRLKELREERDRIREQAIIDAMPEPGAIIVNDPVFSSGAGGGVVGTATIGGPSGSGGAASQGGSASGDTVVIGSDNTFSQAEDDRIDALIEGENAGDRIDPELLVTTNQRRPLNVILENPTFSVVNQGVSAEAINAEEIALMLGPAMQEMIRRGELEAQAPTNVDTV